SMRGSHCPSPADGAIPDCLEAWGWRHGRRVSSYRHQAGPRRCLEVPRREHTEAGLPKMYMTGVDLLPSGIAVPRQPIMKSIDRPESVNQREVWPQGDAKGVRQYMAQHPESWLSANPLSVVNTLMSIAAERNSDSVGRPFSIVRMDAGTGGV